MSIIKLTLIEIYGYLLRVLVLFIQLGIRFSPKLNRFNKNRTWSKDRFDEIIKIRNSKKYCVLYYCSSAGEYEQALPIIDRLSKNSDVFQLVLFFSESGIEFKKSSDRKLFYLKSPYDFPWLWRKIFSKIRPNIILTIRHEIWPAFTYYGSKLSKIALINGSLQEKKIQGSFLKKLILKKLYSIFDEIFVTGVEQKRIFKKVLSLDTKIANDTKYDRVQDRARGILSGLNSELVVLKNSVKRHNVLVLGSGWEPDILAILNAYKKLKMNDLNAKWVVFIVPHNISLSMIQWIKRKLIEFDLSYDLASKNKFNPKNSELLIVDKIGVLAEIYSFADLAMIGGALDHKVHNVLEPASFNVPVCFGPNYKNSEEAIYLVQNNCAEVVTDENQLFKWWQTRITKNQFKDSNIQVTLNKKQNGTNILIDYMNTIIPLIKAG